MAQYDPAILQKYADRLYAQADLIIAICTFVGLLLGLLGGLLLVSVSRSGSSGALPVLGAVVLGLLGFLIGRERAFDLKLKAQQTLCQMKIEENTRSQLPAKSDLGTRKERATSPLTSPPSPSTNQAPPSAPTPAPDGNALSRVWLSLSRKLQRVQAVPGFACPCLTLRKE